MRWGRASTKGVVMVVEKLRRLMGVGWGMGMVEEWEKACTAARRERNSALA